MTTESAAQRPTSLITRNSDVFKNVFFKCVLSHYLGLDPNFDEAADDGEHVADDEQDVPAVDELHSVAPAHAAAEAALKETHVLLQGDDKDGCYGVFLNVIFTYSGRITHK